MTDNITRRGYAKMHIPVGLFLMLQKHLMIAWIARTKSANSTHTAEKAMTIQNSDMMRMLHSHSQPMTVSVAPPAMVAMPKMRMMSR